MCHPQVELLGLLNVGLVQVDHVDQWLWPLIGTRLDRQTIDTRCGWFLIGRQYQLALQISPVSRAYPGRVLESTCLIGSSLWSNGFFDHCGMYSIIRAEPARGDPILRNRDQHVPNFGFRTIPSFWVKAWTLLINPNSISPGELFFGWC